VIALSLPYLTKRRELIDLKLTYTQGSQDRSHGKRRSETLSGAVLGLSGRRHKSRSVRGPEGKEQGRYLPDERKKSREQDYG